MTLTRAQIIENTETIILNDGRVLAYAEYGDPDGFPVFYFHGGQESRLSAGFMNDIAKELKVRLVAPDRPGIGLSTFQPARTFKDWSSDVTQLADSLGFQKFSIFGLSGGSPHVLACAHEIPDRLMHVAVVSGAAPYNYKGKLKGSWFPIKLIHWFAASKNDKNLKKIMDREAKAVKETPEKRIKQLQKYLPGPDKVLLTTEPHLAKEFIEGSQESFKQGTKAAVQEWQLYVRDWGFKLADIRVPIHLWYGDKDKMTPPYRGYYLEEHLPYASLKVLENEGHFSLIRNHIDKILSQLLPEPEVTF